MRETCIQIDTSQQPDGRIAATFCAGADQESLYGCGVLIFEKDDWESVSLAIRMGIGSIKVARDIGLIPPQEPAAQSRPRIFIPPPAPLPRRSGGPLA